MDGNLQYSQREYWDERFKDETSYEWLADFGAVKDLIVPYLKPHSRILHIGCGSSQLSMRLYEMGFTNITNVDYSQVLISFQSRKYPYMRWICDDIRSLDNVEHNFFDVVIEKATIEALLVTEKSPWNPSDQALQTLECVFKAITRSLKPHGIFLSISFTQPHFRVPALLRYPNWAVTVNEFGDVFHYYVFVLQCGTKTPLEVHKKFAQIAPAWGRNISNETQ